MVLGSRALKTISVIMVLGTRVLKTIGFIMFLRPRLPPRNAVSDRRLGLGFRVYVLGFRV